MTKDFLYYADVKYGLLMNNMHDLSSEAQIEGCMVLAVECTERLLKHILDGNGIIPPTTHNLKALLKLCSELYPELSLLRRDIAIYSDTYYLHNYPGDDTDEFTKEDLDCVLELIAKLRDVKLPDKAIDTEVSLPLSKLFK